MDKEIDVVTYHIFVINQRLSASSLTYEGPLYQPMTKAAD